MSTLIEAEGRARHAALTPGDIGLYAVTVFVWGTSWIALHWQLGIVDPAVSLVWRFLIAAAVMLAFCAATGRPLGFPLRAHWRFAALGLLLFSSNFLLFYIAGLHLVSGLLSVVFSLTAVVNVLLSAAILREPIRPRILAGAALGLAGVFCLFWPEVAGRDLGSNAAFGLALAGLGVLSFSLGNMLSAANQRAGIPVASTNALGMSYGVLVNAVFAFASGSAFIIEPTLRYVGSLLWLAVLSTVIAFFTYLTLLGRIGADRAGYSTVMFPVVALAISTIFEDYRWSAASVLGLLLVAAGNVIVLRRGHR